MVVYDYINSITLVPPEAISPLLVDSDAVLTFPIAFQRLEPVPWWYSQVLK